MKNFFLIALLFSVISCTKTEEPAPILGDVVQGNYTVTNVKISGLALAVPFTNPSNGQLISGTIKATKLTETTASAIVTITAKDTKGTTDTPFDQGKMTLAGDGKVLLNITKDGVAIGTYDVATKTLVVKGTVPNPLDNGKPAVADITAVKM